MSSCYSFPGVNLLTGTLTCGQPGRTANARLRPCRGRDEGLWLNDRWRLTRIAAAGVPLVLMLYPRDHHDMAQ
jgi:hypothetical protein